MDPNANPPLATLDQDDPMAGLEDVVIEDDTPVDNLYQEKLRRMMPDALYSSWEGPGDGRSFVTMSDVGVFLTTRIPPLCPDVLLAVDVPPRGDIRLKKNRSYFIPVIGKPPDLALEIVSNNEGNEDGSKLVDYARFGVRYYVIFDPEQWLGTDILRVFELRGGAYVRTDRRFVPDLGLGFMLWDGKYEDMEATWLRWCDASGRPIKTGAERANHEAQLADAARQRANAEQQLAKNERQRAELAVQRAEVEKQRADEEKQRADEESRKVEKLRALLKAQGIDPDAIQ